MEQATASYPLKTVGSDQLLNGKYLLNASLECQGSGVYYSGKGEITNGVYKTIYLPDNAFIFAKNLTAHVTCVCNRKCVAVRTYGTSDVENASFTVFGLNGEFNWFVSGERIKREDEF
jgi:hypothetical protein